MFLIFVENRVDNREMFLLLLSSAFVVSMPAPFTAPPVRRLGMHKMLEEIQPGQLTPTDQRDVPDYVGSRSVHKANGLQRKKDNLESNCVCLPKASLHMKESFLFEDG